LRNVSDCDSTGTTHGEARVHYVWLEKFCLQGDMFHCTLALGCFIPPNIFAHSLYHCPSQSPFLLPVIPSSPPQVQFCLSMSPSIFLCQSTSPSSLLSRSCFSVPVSHLSLVLSSSLSPIPSVFSCVIPAFWVPCS
jgi:hypothetical protein